MLALVLTVVVGALLAAAAWWPRFSRPRRRRGGSFATGPSGELLIADTPEWWAEWRSGIDRDIQDELDSNPHRGGQPSWNDAWLERLVTNSRGVEHARRYVAYIVEARRRAGLPELTGYVWEGSGPVFLVDTPERFAAHQARTDRDIAAQLAGEKPMWGRMTWAEEWDARIERATISYGAAASRYVDYIHQARRDVPGR